jgi:uncharacterized protein
LRLAVALAAFGFAGCDHEPPGHAALAPIESGSGWCKQVYPALTGRVVDEAGILPAASETKLSGQLAELERRTGHELVVATVKSLQEKALEEYSVCLARHWKIGRQKVDNGILLLVAPKERVARIEVGYGLENALRDDEAAAIMGSAIIPAFAAGDYVRGIEAGTAAIIREVS